MSLPNQQIDQDQLVSRLKAQDADAFSYLYDNYSAAIYGAISRIVSDEDVAQEVLQDAFMKFWDKIDQYDSSKGRFFTWMVNICRNLAIDKLRSKEMKKVGKTDNIETYVTGIEQTRLNHLNVDGIGLKETLASLRDEEKFILEMVYFKGYTQSEISDEFDIPLGTVKNTSPDGIEEYEKSIASRVNIEEYISSGILEAYVMDQLSAAERTEVEQHAAEHPEIREELEAIELSMETLAFATAVKPPESVKDQLMQQISGTETKGETPKEKETPVVSMQPTKGLSMLRFAAAASVLVALTSAVMAFSYWSKWQSAEDRLADVIAQNQQFADNYNQVNQQLDDIQNAVSIMNNTAYKRVVMAGTDNSPDAQATVYWNETTADVYLSIQNLKELSKDQQYQLWAIIDSKPVDAGVFDPNTGTFLVQMKNINSGAAAFAVTIEPRGGSENPSLETMQVVEMFEFD